MQAGRVKGWSGDLLWKFFILQVKQLGIHAVVSLINTRSEARSEGLVIAHSPFLGGAPPTSQRFLSQPLGALRHPSTLLRFWVSCLVAESEILFVTFLGDSNVWPVFRTTDLRKD